MASASAIVRASNEETCDHCGSTDTGWIKCKLICRNCRHIIKSCADLAVMG